MAHRQSPRELPSAHRKRGNFAPRRSYARARASRDKVQAVDRILRNQRSQAKFASHLKLTINILCGIGIIALVVYTFIALKHDDISAKKTNIEDLRYR